MSRKKPMDPVDAVLIGAGNRGRFTYGAYARANPERLRILAVAEPHKERREALAAEHGLAPEACFQDWRELLTGPHLAPVAIVATGDMLHVEPALAALEGGHHLLLEKPMAPDALDCLRVVEAAEASGCILQIGHVLRYTPFYNRVHEILESNVLGDIVDIDMKEHVGYWHMAHSFVRGKFRNRAVAAPIILAKTCHDLDLMTWFVDRPALRVSSFGSTLHFRSAAAPEGAPERCTDGCPAQSECPFDAERFYLGPDAKVARSWPWSDLGSSPERDDRRRALQSGPYGRCVYRCDNDVPDHQVLCIEFEGGVTATFTLQGLASEETRTVRITGTRGELRGVLQAGLLEVTRHGRFGVERSEVEASALDHYGGDRGLLDHFTDVVSRGANDEVRASGRVALESHILGFAAEEARQSRSVVELATVWKELRAANSRTQGS